MNTDLINNTKYDAIKTKNYIYEQKKNRKSMHKNKLLLRMDPLYNEVSKHRFKVDSSNQTFYYGRGSYYINCCLIGFIIENTEAFVFVLIYLTLLIFISFEIRILIG